MWISVATHSLSYESMYSSNINVYMDSRTSEHIIYLGGDSIVLKNTILTKRDVEFLKDLYKVEMLNSQRITRLFGNYKYTMKRLKQLETNGYIKIIGYLPNKEHVYSVTNKFCRVIGASYQQVKKEVSLHTLACTDVYFYLKDRLSHFELEKDFSRTFRSDILIMLNNRYMLVEIDLSNRRFQEKVNRWEQFYTHGSFKKHFDIFPPILIISTNSDKVKAVIDSVTKIELNYSYKNYERVLQEESNYER